MLWVTRKTMTIRKLAAPVLLALGCTKPTPTSFTTGGDEVSADKVGGRRCRSRMWVERAMVVAVLALLGCRSSGREVVVYTSVDQPFSQPVFDAADFFRCGRDIFVTRSNVTNLMGIEWLRRHLGDGYTIHEIESRCPNPMHIDTTILPLGPGKLLINPEYIDVDRLPPILKKWDILVTPEPDPIDDRLLKITSLCGKWLSMNILMIDEKRVIVDPHHKNLMKAMKDWGLEPIPCEFLHYAAFGGAFHCATLDVRRRGTLQSYF